ncbi:tRNA-splicing endonuclease subunit Sen15 [Pyxicephalus adspersus]|uniref:tRNA-splicing endonuclease subunit Sen15 domain-containing protein n=1 Tax=Pyxicephalus adspersus TaxID=30357 RepID=A0AAV2ZUC8_PYXAD|nr:TPA: hypothetical protein GDO54_016489 [Pyxicephalus adspersus]
MDTEQVGIVADLNAGAREGAEPWILEHPRFKEMISLEVADSSQVYCAFLAYIDLLEVRNWHDVQILSSSELHLVYLRGREKIDHVPQIIIPTPVTMSCTHERIQQYLKLGHTEDEMISYSILLGIVESDSTIVYYKLTEGFVIPDPPDFAEDVENKRWKKKKIRCLR